MQSDNPYNSKVNKYPTLTTDLILLLGNDYHKNYENNGVVKVLSGSLPSLPRNATDEQRRTRMRIDDSIIDRLAKADDRDEFLRLNAKKGGLTDEDLVQYKKVRQHVLHAPVLEFDCNTQARQV